MAIMKMTCISLLLSLCLVSFTACEREVDLRPEGKGSIVVECVLSQESTQTLRLSLTDIAYVSLKDADITLTDESRNEIVGKFVFQDRDRWTLDYLPVSGHRYLLTIKVDGFDIVQARTTMPDAMKVEYTIMSSVFPQNFDFEGFPDWELGTRISIKSLPESAVWISGMNYEESLDKHIPAKTIATSLESADLFNLIGETYWNAFNPQADSYYEKMYGNEDYRGYWVYSLPPQCRPTMYRYVVGCALHDTFLRIPPLKENGNRTAPDPKGYFSVAGDFQGFTYGISSDGGFSLTPEETDGYIMFMSFSEEYDCYLKELLMKEAGQASEKDFASLFSSENLYGNVENGLGIFGAKTAQEIPWVKNNPIALWGFDYEW